jgi:excisionase family DNA binding protein
VARRRFLGVAETALVLGIGKRTLERAIAEGRFPAVRVGRRLVIPERAIDLMAEQAITTSNVVDASDYVAVQAPAS